MAEDLGTGIQAPIIGQAGADALNLGGLGFGKNIPATVRAGADLYKQEGAAVQKKQAETKAIEAEREAKKAAMQSKSDSLTGDLKQTLEKGADTAPTPDPVKFTPTDIQHGMGWIMALAALSGMSSRQPLTASLNAMAGMIQGVKEGDDARFQRDAKIFDENMKIAIEKNAGYAAKFKNIVESKKLSITEQHDAIRLLDLEYDRKVGQAAGNLTDTKGQISQGYKFVQSVEKAREFQQKAADMAQQRKSALEAKQTQVVTGPDGKMYRVNVGALPEMPEGMTGAGKFGASGGAVGATGPVNSADKANAWSIVLNGKSIPGMYGMGDKAGRARSQQALEQIMAENNMTPTDLVMIGNANASVKGALNDISKREANVRVIQEKLVGHGEKLLDLVKKGGGTSESVHWNNAEVWAKQHLNNEDAVLFVNQMNLFGNEFARLSSPASNAMLPEGARDESREALNKGYTEKSLSGIVDLIKYDANISHKAFANERQRLLHSMTESVGGAGSPVSGAHQPYSDPEKEKRYQEWKAQNAH